MINFSRSHHSSAGPRGKVVVVVVVIVVIPSHHLNAIPWSYSGRILAVPQAVVVNSVKSLSYQLCVSLIGIIIFFSHGTTSLNSAYVR